MAFTLCGYNDSYGDGYGDIYYDNSCGYNCGYGNRTVSQEVVRDPEVTGCSPRAKSITTRTRS